LWGVSTLVVSLSGLFKKNLHDGFISNFSQLPVLGGRVNYAV